VNFHGSELSGFNTYEGGVEVRVPKLGARVLPFAQASLGRLPLASPSSDHGTRSQDDRS
jgi:hypothetical protein